jgi:hypothetical protein
MSQPRYGASRAASNRTPGRPRDGRRRRGNVDFGIDISCSWRWIGHFLEVDRPRLPGGVADHSWSISGSIDGTTVGSATHTTHTSGQAGWLGRAEADGLTINYLGG